MARQGEKPPATSSGPAAPAGSPRRRGAGKSTKGPAGEKIKATFYLSPDAMKRLGVVAAMESRDRSAIIESLIQEHLRHWVVSYRGGRPDDPAPAELPAA